MNESSESRALKIAAHIMHNAGLCRYESYSKCRRIHVDDIVCEKCIRAWLIAKAKQELMKKERHGKVDQGSTARNQI